MPAAKRSAHVAPEVNLRERTLHSPLQKSNKTEPTLALKPRGDVIRNPKQGYQGPQKKTRFGKCSGGSRIFQMGGRCFVANGGAHILFSGKKCMKLKEIGLKWGGARLLAPCYSKITIFPWIILNSIMKTSYFTYFENNLLKRPPGSLGAMVLLQNCSFDT